MHKQVKWVLVSATVIAGLLIVNLGCGGSGSPASSTPSSSTPVSTPSKTPTSTPPAPSTPSKTPSATLTPTATSTTTTTPSASATTTPPPATTPTQGSGPSLSDILSKGIAIPSVKYDLVTTNSALGTVTATVWVKKNKMRTETTAAGTTVLVLIDLDAKTMITYTQNTAFQMNLDPTLVPASATGTAQSLQSYNPTVLGTETIDGKVCTIIQYTVPGTNPVSAKTWIWQERGLPIKIETTTVQGITTVLFKNMDFSDIPDSTFSLPAGVTVGGLPSIPGLPNIPGLPK